MRDDSGPAGPHHQHDDDDRQDQDDRSYSDVHDHSSIQVRDSIAVSPRSGSSNRVQCPNRRLMQHDADTPTCPFRSASAQPAVMMLLARVVDDASHDDPPPGGVRLPIAGAAESMTFLLA